MHVVVFTGGQAPLPNDTVFYFAHTPKIDYIIAADEGLDTLEAYRHFYGTTHNFRPDYILGDMDSLKDESLLKKYASVHTEIYNTEKDYTDTELAIQKAESLGLNRRRGDMITLIGGSGGLSDHFLGIYDMFSTDCHADVWLCGRQALCFLDEGYGLRVSHIRPDQRISIARPTSSYSDGKIYTEGLEWESPLFRKSGMPSISNKISKEYYEKGKKLVFRVEKGRFIVFLPLSAYVEHVILPA